MRTTHLKYVFILLILSFKSNAGDHPGLFTAANKFYSDEKYDSALSLYREIIDNGFVSPELYFNAGNACFKLKNLPQAIVYYERAKKLSPGDDDIEFNLKLANSRTVDKIESIPPLFYEVWFEHFANILKADGWPVAALVFLWSSLFLICLYFILSGLMARKACLWLGLVFLPAAGICFALAGKQYRCNTVRNEAVVFFPTIAVKSSPDERGTDIFILHEGTKVAMLDELGEWRKIKLADGSVGWLKMEAIEVI